MSTGVTAAVVAAAAALASAVLAGWSQSRTRRLERLLDDQARTQAVFERYSEPLVVAAYELQSRLWNIVRGGFLERYGQHGKDAERGYAVTSTLWLIAQYFAFNEILLREAQFLHLEDRRKTLQIQHRLHVVSRAFATDSIGQPMRVFRAQQHAIGEIMVTSGRDATGATRTDALGYATFCSSMEEDPRFALWLGDVEADLRAALLRPQQILTRMIAVQHLLIDLIDEIDRPPTRFPVLRGRIDEKCYYCQYTHPLPLPGRSSDAAEYM